jgi:O-antigen/teichoic acid export membrane protein
VTFPITARLLTNSDFGIVGYYETLSLVWVAVLKLGSQHSIMRFYASHCHGQGPEERQRFHASLVLGPAVVSTVLYVLSMAGVWAWGYFRPDPMLKYLYLVLTIGHLGVLFALIDNLVRAREMSRFASRLMMAGRVVQAVCVLGVVYFVYRSALGMFFGRLLAAGTLLVVIWWWFLKDEKPAPRRFDRGLFFQGMAFGMPLVLSEISMVLLAYVDRVMLKSMLGSFEEVGVYYLGYGLAMNFGTILGATTYQAFSPVANRLYETEGDEAVRRLKHRVVKALAYVAVLACCFLLVIGRDFFILLAGADKAASVPVFQWIGFNYALTPIFNVAAYGLVLVRRSKVIASVTVAATLLNVALNYVLIPRLGMIGCVYATVASYVFMGIGEWWLCPANLRTRLNLDLLGWPVLLGVALVAVAEATHLLGAPGPIARMAVMTVLAVLLYALPVMWLDPEMRALLRREGPLKRRSGTG